jgi:hypothetical protein
VYGDASVIHERPKRILRVHERFGGACAEPDLQEIPLQHCPALARGRVLLTRLDHVHRLRNALDDGLPFGRLEDLIHLLVDCRKDLTGEAAILAKLGVAGEWDDPPIL